MNKRLLMVKSITFAMKGRTILAKSGISAAVQRTPKTLETESCGYCIAVPAQAEEAALGILADSGIVVTGVLGDAEK